ncbi:MAG: hypothetical protein ACRDKB_01945 [Actinomycetota bacterium]
MTRAIVAGVITILVVLAAASGAVAQQRDPFEPLVEPGAGGEAPAGETGTQPGPQPAEPGADRLADTGGETAPWLAVAYALAAIGAGAVVLSRTLRPTLARPPRRAER